MTTLLKDVQALLSTNLRKQLYLAISYPTASIEALLPYLAEHLRYMKKVEHEIFLSGPFITEGLLVGEGLTILRTNSDVRAGEIMRNEPFIKHGLRRFELKLWEIREGSITITANLSTSGIDIG